MGLINLFKLSKLTLTAYQDSERKKPVRAPNSLEVQYNPESLTTRHESTFQGRQGIATSSAQARFSYSRSETLSVSLIFDGTNVGYMGVELLRPVPTVSKRVSEFLRLCYRLNSDSHEPSYLKLSWDKGVLGPAFDCRLKSVEIKYTSFNRDGSPLRAELNAEFIEDRDPKKKALMDRLSSPDLSHRRMVVAGDTLPMLCQEIYGSAAHYLRVAEVNGLDDFRVLTPGQELIFPPFAKAGE